MRVLLIQAILLSVCSSPGIATCRLGYFDGTVGCQPPDKDNADLSNYGDCHILLLKLQSIDDRVSAQRVAGCKESTQTFTIKGSDRADVTHFVGLAFHAFGGTLKVSGAKHITLFWKHPLCSQLAPTPPPRTHHPLHHCTTLPQTTPSYTSRSIL